MQESQVAQALNSHINTHAVRASDLEHLCKQGPVTLWQEGSSNGAYEVEVRIECVQGNNVQYTMCNNGVSGWAEADKDGFVSFNAAGDYMWGREEDADRYEQLINKLWEAQGA